MLIVGAATHHGSDDRMPVSEKGSAEPVAQKQQSLQTGLKAEYCMIATYTCPKLRYWKL